MLLKYTQQLFVVALLWTLSPFCYALNFPLPANGDDIVGQVQTVYAEDGDTLTSIDLKYNIGIHEIIEANRSLSKRGELTPGAPVIIPAHYILPSIRQGLVINLAELRLYYFPVNQATVYTFPIGVGRKGWQTPTATTELVRKVKDPKWTVPESIRRESARKGKILPKIVPAGPKNPLGKYALRLALPGILIHGTTAPASVGLRGSHGCMRMLAEDIKFLYENVPVGTPVHIIHESNKVGWFNNQLYIEVETPFDDYANDHSIEALINEMIAQRPAKINWQAVNQFLEDQDGMPHVIGENFAKSNRYFEYIH